MCEGLGVGPRATDAIDASRDTSLARSSRAIAMAMTAAMTSVVSLSRARSAKGRRRRTGRRATTMTTAMAFESARATRASSRARVRANARVVAAQASAVDAGGDETPLERASSAAGAWVSERLRAWTPPKFLWRTTATLCCLEACCFV